MSVHQKALIALIIAHVIWGASSPIAKLALVSIPPFTLATIRFWLTACILVFFLIVKKQTIAIKRRDIRPVILWALLSVPVNIGLFFWGLAYTTSIDAAVIGSLVPIFTAVAAHFFLQEKLKTLNGLGVATAFLGSLIIIGSPLLALNTGDGLRLFGNILSLLAALSWVFGTIILKGIANAYKPIILTTLAFTLGFFTMLPLAFVEYLQNPNWIYHLSAFSFFGIAYVVIGNSILAYTLFHYAIRVVSATAANTVSYIMPVVAASIAIPILGERLTIPFLIGSAIIVIGVFLAETRHAAHPLHKYTHRKPNH